MKYSLSDSFSPGFNLISELSDGDVKSVCNIIKNAELGEQPEELADKSLKEVNIPKEKLTAIFSTIFSLVNFLQENEKADQSIIGDIVESFSIDFNFNDEKKKSSLASNLNKIIFTDGLILQTVKGFNLLSEGDKVFMKSKIISDVRFVFDNDITKKTKGAVLVHQLKLTFRESGEWKDIFITLDSNDLNKLSESIQRALEKENVIYNNIFTKDLCFIKPTKN